MGRTGESQPFFSTKKKREMLKLTLQKMGRYGRSSSEKEHIARSDKTHSTNVVVKLGAQSIAHKGGGMGPCKLVLLGGRRRRRRRPKFCG
jgi:hypothetical protein